MEIRFVWDEVKAHKNIEKHGVSFKEAIDCFYDERALFISDPLHSIGEERFVLMGMSSSFHILVVVHVYREEDFVVRIISARKATRKEMHQYFGR